MALHVASVEPALVALVWQMLLGLCCGFMLSMPTALLVPAGVWLAYSADRHGDGSRGGRARHASSRDASRFWRLWLSVFAVAVFAGSWLLDLRQVVASGLGLTWITAYLALTQRYPRLRAIVPREVVVGLTFAIGTTLFVSPIVTTTVDVSMWWSVTLAFAALCTWSCVAASWLERDEDRRRGAVTIVTHYDLTPRGIGAFGIVLGILLSCAVGFVLYRASSRDRLAIAVTILALAMSFAMLGLQLMVAKRGRASARLARWTDFLLLPAPLVALGVLWVAGSAIGTPG
ncbi:MAG: hypothetical protein KDC95_21205 [Planctomycetes bacterium]|nr:hypothetical protein [Planctomycetota bacterium]